MLTPTCRFRHGEARKKNWKIPSGIFQPLIPKLFKNKEFSGNLILGQDHNKEPILKLGQIKSGHTASVKVENGICNFHTHPYFCYTGMGEPDDATIWGWPSGEDIRETLVFALRGNLIHLVITLEGIYSIEVNPYIIQILKEIQDSNIKGYIISFIEHYFKATHGFRCCDYNTNQRKKCTPKDWVIFANEFTLNNFYLRSKDAGKCTKSLPCSGFPDYDDNYRKVSHDYKKINPKHISDYALDGHKLRVISHSKTEKHKKKQTIEDYIPRFSIAKGSWKKGQWFKVKFIPNKIKGRLLNHDLIDKLNVKDMQKLWKKVSKEQNALEFSGLVSFCSYELENQGSCMFPEVLK